jgi:YgiT-type zinc finger domain-containing protein
MEAVNQSKTFIQKAVTYSLELDSKFYVVENFPARVCVETGETFFAPETLDRLQEIIWEKKNLFE